MDTLVNINGLALSLRLPVAWLKRETMAGRIPCLKIGRRCLFNVDAVRKALAERAATGVVHDEREVKTT